MHINRTLGDLVFPKPNFAAGPRIEIGIVEGNLKFAAGLDNTSLFTIDFLQMSHRRGLFVALKKLTFILYF